MAREYELEMYGICKAILIYEKDCSDVIQEALLKAYSKLHTLREDRYFKTWLFRILINQCNTMRKRERRYVSVESEYLNSFPDTEQNYTELYMCIDQLAEKQRQVIILHYINGYSIEEISEFLELSPGTVKSRLHRARQELKSTYGEVTFA